MDVLMEANNSYLSHKRFRLGEIEDERRRVLHNMTFGTTASNATRAAAPAAAAATTAGKSPTSAATPLLQMSLEDLEKRLADCGCGGKALDLP